LAAVEYDLLLNHTSLLSRKLSIDQQGSVEWAMHPNLREKASYLTENILPLSDHNRIQFIEDNTFLLPQG